MAYWDCPRCAAENSLDSTTCWRCGFQNYGAARESTSHEHTAPSPDVAGKQRQGLMDDIKKSVDEGLERTRATLDRLARGGGNPDKT